MEKVMDEVIDNPELFELFAAYADVDENLLGAMHILIALDDFDSEDEAMEFAMEIWERATSGEDFFELKMEYSQDPGRFSFPDGYTFGPGEMVPEFEAGTRALEIGEISEPILAIHPHYQGIHIILRVEPMLSFREMEDLIIQAFEAKVDAADIVLLPALQEIPVN
jgi:hypothetical protein